MPRLKWRLQFAVIFLSCFAAVASAQQSSDSQTMPDDANRGEANSAIQGDQNSDSADPNTTKAVSHGRKPTLQELYGMFFNFAAHVETTAVAGIEKGRNMTFYRTHLQKASGLDETEYAYVLESAQRFAEVDADVDKQIADGMKALKDPGTDSTQRRQFAATCKSLSAQRASALAAEIENVRERLGQERAAVFESYLQTKYLTGTNVPASATKK